MNSPGRNVYRSAQRTIVRLWWITALALALAALCAAQTPQFERGRNGMVVTSEKHASAAGLAVLKSGGNAVDAAVAAAFALAVTHPAAGNIGGGGFLLVRLAGGETNFIDFREQAPLAATEDMYLGPDGKPTQDSVIGWRAAGVPGTVRGLELAHRRYGKLAWKDVAAPAVKLARDGFALSAAQARSLNGSRLLAQFPESRRIFQRNGTAWSEGDVLKQPELAQVLERIAAAGAQDFYEGETARRLADAMRAHGGLITLEDLRRYRAVERAPLSGGYKGYTILSAPPPSSGGAGLLQVLGVLAGTGYEKSGPGSAPTIHYVAEALRRFFAERGEFLGDPDFERLPVAGLLDPRHLDRLRRSIDPERATPSRSLRAGAPLFEAPETTHLTAVDRAGNAAALTYTLNGSFGSGVTVPGLGFLLNNEMDDFSVQPGFPNSAGLVQGRVNAIRAGKRPLSSMTPTIVLKDGQFFLALGSPGSGRIISSVLQVLLNVIDHRMPLAEAVAYPRFHHQWLPDRLYVEPGFRIETLRKLEAMGHAVEQTRGIGEVQAVWLNGGWLEGVADPRGEGAAGGY